MNTWTIIVVILFLSVVFIFVRCALPYLLRWKKAMKRLEQDRIEFERIAEIHSRKQA